MGRKGLNMPRKKKATTTATTQEQNYVLVLPELATMNPTKGRLAGKTVKNALVLRPVEDGGENSIELRQSELPEYLFTNLASGKKQVVYPKVGSYAGNKAYDSLKAACFGKKKAPAKQEKASEPAPATVSGPRRRTARKPVRVAGKGAELIKMSDNDLASFIVENLGREALLDLAVQAKASL